jgi:hypothetical protein
VRLSGRQLGVEAAATGPRRPMLIVVRAIALGPAEPPAVGRPLGGEPTGERLARGEPRERQAAADALRRVAVEGT